MRCDCTLKKALAPNVLSTWKAPKQCYISCFYETEPGLFRQTVFFAMLYSFFWPHIFHHTESTYSRLQHTFALYILPCRFHVPRIDTNTKTISIKVIASSFQSHFTQFEIIYCWYYVCIRLKFACTRIKATRSQFYVTIKLFLVARSVGKIL